MAARLAYEPGRRLNSFFYHKGDGYYYNHSYSTSSTIYFVCASSNCNGRAKMLFGGELVHTIPHNHSARILVPEFFAARRHIVTQARQLSHMSFSQIIQQERRRIPNRDLRSRLTYRSLRPAMQRSRSSVFPRVPRTLRNITAIHLNPAWAHLTETCDLEDSIYLGSVDAVDGSHSIIYTSQRNLQTLREVSTIFADGTFSISPSVNNCYQVFTIVTVLGHTVIPLLWCLMESKTEAAYLSVFYFLRARLRFWNFTKAICDFEEAMMNAFRIVFNIDVQGCYFHYVNGLGRWACSNISVHVFQTYQEIVNIVLHCCVLPLLPSHLLGQGFQVIIDEALDLGLHLFLLSVPFLLYVQKSWLEHPTRGQTMSVAGSAHRTNNASESNNKRMNRLVQCVHPNVYRLINHFKEIEDATLDDLNSLALGHVPSRHRHAHSISNDNFIISLTRQLLQVPEPTDAQIAAFLHSAAGSVRNVVQNALGLQPQEP